jgi:spermidine synthase
MPELNSSKTPSHTPSSPFLPLLLVLFVGSGCAALIYEIIWLQLLQLIIGSTAVSLGLLLGTFMGGMCLGSLALPHIISPLHHPLRVYAALEIGIGFMGLLVLFGMPYVEKLYVVFGHGTSGFLLRGMVSGICLLSPTLLMGATLPAIARWVETTPRGVSWLGFFYGGNIAGAVFGCLLSGFYLLRVHDMAVATYFASSVNATVSLLAFFLAILTKHRVPNKDLSRALTIRAHGAWAVYVAIGLSGLCALGAEVVWTRLISLIFGGTVYTFSIILAVFLMGLGIGSGAGSFMARSRLSPQGALVACQLLLAGAIAWTAHMVSDSIPYWPIDPSISMSPWYAFQLDLVRCMWAVLPAACLWGASFPLALAAVASHGQDPGRLVAGVYAANTVGAIIGSLAFSLLLIPQVDTQNAQRLLAGLSLTAALVMLSSFLRPSTAGDLYGGLSKPAMRIAGAGVAVGVVVWIILCLPPVPWGLIAYGRHLASYAKDLAPGVVYPKDIPSEPGTPDEFCLYVAEGSNVSIAVSQTRRQIRSFHGGGKVQASTYPKDMRLQRMLGHIPALVHQDPKSVLVVACGAGITAGCFILHPGVERIVICDIEPLVPQFVAPMFTKENYNVVGEENAHRVEIVHDDGRHFIRTTNEKFDIITSDPIDPWVKGCAALNTLEYFQMCKEHLNPGGVMALWMPLYESDPDTLKSAIATFFKVFPNGILWTNDFKNRGYDSVLFGQVEPTVINVDALEQRLNQADHRRVKQSLEEIGFDSVHKLLATYAGQAQHMQEWVKNAQINTDRNLRLQYLAGLLLNTIMGKELLREILQQYQFPENIFTGSDAHLQALKRELAAAQRR